MRNSTHHAVTQWLLLCALFLGVIGMHHVAMSGDTPSPHSATSATAHEQPAPEHPSPQPAHDMLHLCVAVLCAVVSLLLLAWSLMRAGRPAADRLQVTTAWPRAPDHPPPIGGRTLLSSVCVLRL